METIRLGKTNMMVSRVGLGSIPIQRLTTTEAVAVVRRCLELGITFIDTANGYTTSEGRVGQAIAGRRDGLFIATKSHSRTRDGIERHLNQSLKLLGVEYIDLYQFHGVSDTRDLDMVLDANGPMAILEEAKKRGVIRHIGISSHQIDVAKKAIKSDRFETIMFGFNFMTQEVADELLPLAREHDVGFIAMKPFGGGMIDNIPVAVKYLLQFPDVLMIPGIEKIAEIEEIVQLLNGTHQLSKAEEQTMQRIRAELGTSFCHRCEYCQPCNQAIPISRVITSRSFARRLPTERLFSGEMAEGIAKAADCIECGECETRCPYHLPIRDMLAEHVNWYQEEKRKYQERVAPSK
ncbi:MAG: Aldo/keto reductase [Dehalococcoidales bacterium]|nr:Aldo/keto reductase [Dehalococcoidales bacterium]